MGSAWAGPANLGGTLEKHTGCSRCPPKTTKCALAAPCRQRSTPAAKTQHTMAPHPLRIGANAQRHETSNTTGRCFSCASDEPLRGSAPARRAEPGPLLGHKSGYMFHLRRGDDEQLVMWCFEGAPGDAPTHGQKVPAAADDSRPRSTSTTLSHILKAIV